MGILSIVAAASPRVVERALPGCWLLFSPIWTLRKLLSPFNVRRFSVFGSSLGELWLSIAYSPEIVLLVKIILLVKIVVEHSTIGRVPFPQPFGGGVHVISVRCIFPLRHAVHARPLYPMLRWWPVARRRPLSHIRTLGAGDQLRCLSYAQDIPRTASGQSSRLWI